MANTPTAVQRGGQQTRPKSSWELRCQAAEAELVSLREQTKELAIEEEWHLHYRDRAIRAESQVQALRAALKRLQNEAHAILALSYDEIKGSAGYTNLSVFQLRLSEAEKLLALGASTPPTQEP